MINEEQLNRYIGKVNPPNKQEWERRKELERQEEARRAERIAPFLMELAALMQKHNVDIDYDPKEFYERAIWTIDGVDHGSVFDNPNHPQDSPSAGQTNENLK